MHAADIRAANEADASAVVEYRSTLRAERLPTLFRYDQLPAADEEAKFLRKFQDDLDRAFFVAVLDSAVVGHLDLVGGNHAQTRHVAMLGMSVLAPHRGLGIGSRLLEAGIAWAAQADLRKIQLEVMSNNPRAQALYEKHGFELEGARKKVVLVDGDYVDLIQMGLALPGERRITSP